MSVVWRDAVHADLPRITELWVAQTARLRDIAPTVNAPMPELFYPVEETDHAFFPFKPPVLRVRVAERDGVVIASRIVEAVCEVQLIGGDQETMHSLGRELPEECHWAKSKGFRSGFGMVPKALKAPILRSLRHTPLQEWPSLTLVGCDFSDLGD